MDKELSASAHFGFAAFWGLSLTLSLMLKDWWLAPFELGLCIYNFSKGLSVAIHD